MDDRHYEASADGPIDRLTEQEKLEHLRILAALPVDTPLRRTHHHRRRRTLVIVASAVVGLSAAGVGTAAALGAFSAQPSDRTVAHCYATSDLTDPGNHTDFIVLLDTGTNGSDIGDAAASAMDICSEGWRQGRFSTTDPKVKPPPFTDPVPAHPVPPLIACVLPSGQVGVFPGDTNTCTALNLPVALP